MRKRKHSMIPKLRIRDSTFAEAQTLGPERGEVKGYNTIEKSDLIVCRDNCSFHL